MKKIDVSDRLQPTLFGGCHDYTGNKNPDGYGRVGSELAHRKAYEAVHGPIPAGLWIDHLCRNRLCCPRENILRSPDTIASKQSRQNVCHRNSISRDRVLELGIPPSRFKSNHCQYLFSARSAHAAAGAILRVRSRSSRECGRLNEGANDRMRSLRTAGHLRDEQGTREESVPRRASMMPRLVVLVDTGEHESAVFELR